MLSCASPLRHATFTGKRGTRQHVLSGYFAVSPNANTTAGSKQGDDYIASEYTSLNKQQELMLRPQLATAQPQVQQLQHAPDDTQQYDWLAHWYPIGFIRCVEWCVYKTLLCAVLHTAAACAAAVANHAHTYLGKVVYTTANQIHTFDFACKQYCPARPPCQMATAMPSWRLCNS